MSVLAVCLATEGKEIVVARHTIACALKIDAQADVLVVGNLSGEELEQVTRYESVRCVLSCPISDVGIENAAAQVAQVADGYSHVLFDAGSRSKAVMARVAALKGVPALSEICDVVAPDTFKRFIYAGSLLATVKITVSPVFATVRTTAFDPVSDKADPACVKKIEPADSPRAFTVVDSEKRSDGGVDLESARIVVAAGRGVIDEDGFKAAEHLADRLHAGLASTRALVDAFIAPADTQVGQTGKIVAPDLYMAFGISGAIQHLAGMKDSKVIVAVNTDPEAPIIDVCDYWLEADAVETIKALYAKF